jgi:hypothetical protein
LPRKYKEGKVPLLCGTNPCAWYPNVAGRVYLKQSCLETSVSEQLPIKSGFARL